MVPRYPRLNTENFLSYFDNLGIKYSDYLPDPVANVIRAPRGFILNVVF